MRVIITGATGTIGTALINKLLEKKIEMLIICRNNKNISRIPINKLITIKFCELKDYKDLINDTGKKYDVIYHFAWDGTTGDKREDIYLQNNNIKYSLDAVNLGKRFGCKKFIGAGSQAEYGRTNINLTDKTPTFPETGYGIAKLCAGQMTRKLCQELKMKHIWTRILSVYGPYDNKNSLIMTAINKISNKQELKVTKCEQVWDYIYSKDVAEILYLLSKKGKNERIYVIGSGKNKKLKEYITILRNEINPNYELKFGDIQYSDNQVMHLCADTSVLKNEIKFENKYSFEEGIKELIWWYNEENNKDN